MIIADENIDSGLISKLRASGFAVFSIKENLKGVSDKNIIELVKEKGDVSSGTQRFWRMGFFS